MAPPCPSPWRAAIASVVAHEPEIARRIVIAGTNQPRGSGQRIDADDVDRGLAGGVCVSAILLALRHEAAIDHDDGAAGKPRRREHPIAGA